MGYSKYFFRICLVVVTTSLCLLSILPSLAQPYRNPRIFLHRDSAILYTFENNLSTSVTRHALSLAHIAAIPVLLAIQNDSVAMTIPIPFRPGIEKAEWRKPAQMLFISDIEGNPATLLSLLKAAGVVDAHLNWTFGKGHVAFIGDFVDRGPAVQETLLLAYYIEQLAAKAGGKLHFILGNHEIMHLAGDSSYAHPQYLEQAKAMGMHYADVLGQSSMHGQWLMTKNVAEKIGPFLVVHGGISPYVNSMQPSLTQLNELARPLYRDTTGEGPDLPSTITISEYGPFWYRGYYTGNLKASVATVDSTLRLFGVKHIITGHTVVSKQISSHFSGKVINIDVPHAAGQSEALLWKDDQFFRVLPNGDRQPL
ncbi:MAG: metallophosphoesterase [Bacteroidetes bacterium]|uniref:metallophosphoesterase n=1 Tax=Phnomibacter sp. TaxID=2836217 RepID=UPI002FDE2576|nr:metallophosphoesterase [Bacteroidota bacterium]